MTIRTLTLVWLAVMLMAALGQAGVAAGRAAPVWVLVTVQCYEGPIGRPTPGPMRCGTWPGAPDYYLGRSGETYATEAECAAARIVLRNRVRAQFRGDEPVNLPTGEAVPPASLTTWCLPVAVR